MPKVPPPNQWCAEMAEASDDWAADHNGERPSITEAPYSEGTATEKQWLVDNGYCTA